MLYILSEKKCKMNFTKTPDFHLPLYILTSIIEYLITQQPQLYNTFLCIQTFVVQIYFDAISL